MELRRKLNMKINILLNGKKVVVDLLNDRDRYNAFKVKVTLEI